MNVKLTECPRDAMQGIESFIPTDVKIEYLNKLLACGFDVLDFGSFVSPKAIPQMRDTEEVLGRLNTSTSHTKLLAIVANEKGAERAAQFSEIYFLGFPFSVSETFQKRNTNSSIDESLSRVDAIINLCEKNNKAPLVYLSMAFGNPYGDEWNLDIVAKWTEVIASKGVKFIALADTIGVSNAKNISQLFSTLIPNFQNIEFSAHLHTTPDQWEEKISSVIASGCRSVDVAIKGFGGCPMAADKLTGNLPTEKVLDWVNKNGLTTGVKDAEFLHALNFSSKVFH